MHRASISWFISGKDHMFVRCHMRIHMYETEIFGTKNRNDPA
jgi:hypothetical protein